MQAVPCGQQTNAFVPGTWHVWLPWGQTHFPFWQTIPSGQQNAPLVPGTLQAFSLGQQAPLRQTVPWGQQMTAPDAVTHALLCGGQAQ